MKNSKCKQYFRFNHKNLKELDQAYAYVLGQSKDEWVVTTKTDYTLFILKRIILKFKIS